MPATHAGQVACCASSTWEGVSRIPAHLFAADTVWREKLDRTDPKNLGRSNNGRDGH